MTGPARNDEPGEEQEHPVESEVAPLADKVDERNRNTIIGEREQRIRNDIEPQQRPPPQEAVAMRLEALRVEDALQELSHLWLPPLVRSIPPRPLTPHPHLSPRIESGAGSHGGEGTPHVGSSPGTLWVRGKIEVGGLSPGFHQRSLAATRRTAQPIRSARHECGAKCSDFLVREREGMQAECYRSGSLGWSRGRLTEERRRRFLASPSTWHHRSKGKSVLPCQKPFDGLESKFTYILAACQRLFLYCIRIPVFHTDKMVYAQTKPNQSRKRSCTTVRSA